MIRVIQLIWHGCWHEWQQVGPPVHVYDDASDTMPYAVKGRQKCKKCGRMRGVKI